MGSAANICLIAALYVTGIIAYVCCFLLGFKFKSHISGSEIDEVGNLTNIGKLQLMCKAITGCSIAASFLVVGFFWRKVFVAVHTAAQVVLLGIGIAVVVTATNYNSEGQFDDALQQSLTERFHNPNSSFVNTLAYYEVRYKCCGVNNSHDYASNTYIYGERDLPIPYSCCVLDLVSSFKRKILKNKYCKKNIERDEVANLPECLDDYHNNVTSSEYLHVKACHQPIAEGYLRIMELARAFAIAVVASETAFILTASIYLLHIYELLPYKQLHSISQKWESFRHGYYKLTKVIINVLCQIKKPQENA